VAYAGCVPLNLSFTHLLVVAFVALVVLGPDKLPGVARTAGNLYREWQRISGGLQAEVRDALSEFTEPFTEPISDLLHGPRTDDGVGAVATATVVAAGATAAAAASSTRHADRAAVDERSRPEAPAPAGHAPARTNDPSSRAGDAPVPTDDAALPTGAMRTPAVAASHNPAMPSLGPSTGLVSPGPSVVAIVPTLASTPNPDTFAPFVPGGAGGHAG